MVFKEMKIPCVCHMNHEQQCIEHAVVPHYAAGHVFHPTAVVGSMHRTEGIYRYHHRRQGGDVTRNEIIKLNADEQRCWQQRPVDALLGHVRYKEHDPAQCQCQQAKHMNRYDVACCTQKRC